MARPPVRQQNLKNNIYAKQKTTAPRKPLWSLHDLCAESGLDKYKIAGLMHVASAPTAIFRNGRNTFYDPQEFRAWVKTILNLDKYK